MKLLVWCMSLLLLLGLQTTLAPAVSYGGVQPDLMLCFVLSAAFLGGRSYGLACGFFSGLLQDVATGSLLGLHLLPLVCLGGLAGLAERKVFKDRFLLPVCAAGGATVLAGCFVLVFLALMGLPGGWEGLVAVVLPQAVYNMLVSVPVHRLVHWLYRIS